MPKLTTRCHARADEWLKAQQQREAAEFQREAELRRANQEEERRLAAFAPPAPSTNRDRVQEYQRRGFVTGYDFASRLGWRRTVFNSAVATNLLPQPEMTIGQDRLWKSEVVEATIRKLRGDR